jgi:hypothetical protein
MRRNVKLAAIILGVVLISVPSLSQFRGAGVTIGGAYYWASEDYIQDGYGSNIGFAIPFRQRATLVFDWKYSQFTVDKTEGGFLNGKLHVTPLLVGFQYKLLLQGSVIPYFVGGLGWFFNSYSLDARTSEDEVNIVSQDPKNGLGLYGGIGVNLKLARTFVVYAEGIYLYNRTDVETRYLEPLTPPTQFEVNMSTLSAIVGIRFYY